MRMTKQTQRRRLDPVGTRATILDAALNAFAGKGYDGTSIADIAAAAGVPKSLVQYHFGSKEELWQACLAKRLAPMVEAIDRFLDTGSRDIAELAKTRFRFLQDHPEVRQLFSWASLGPVPIPQVIAERRERVIQQLGGDPSSPEIVKLLLAITAMDGWFLHQHLYRQLLGEQVLDAGFEDRFLDMILQAVKTP